MHLSILEKVQGGGGASFSHLVVAIKLHLQIEDLLGLRLHLSGRLLCHALLENCDLHLSIRIDRKFLEGPMILHILSGCLGIGCCSVDHDCLRSHWLVFDPAKWVQALTGGWLCWLGDVELWHVLVIDHDHIFCAAVPATARSVALAALVCLIFFYCVDLHLFFTSQKFKSFKFAISWPT